MLISREITVLFLEAFKEEKEIIAFNVSTSPCCFGNHWQLFDSLVPSKDEVEVARVLKSFQTNGAGENNAVLRAATWKCGNEVSTELLG